MALISIDWRDDRAVLTLDRPKVNALNMALVTELRAALREVGEARQARGLIIMGQPGYFSAGLDLFELGSYDYEQIYAFWSEFMGLAGDLVRFRKPVVAAMSGHSPAGGTVMAIACDHRIQVEGEQYRLGLNELAVGIPISDTIFDLYSFWLGRRQAYQAIMSGSLFSPEEALQMGLVDALHTPNQLLDAAEARLRGMLRTSDEVLQGAKILMRSKLVAAFDRDASADLEARSRHWVSDAFQARLRGFLEQLKKA